MSMYEIAILGAASEDDRETLITTLGEMVADFEMVLGVDIMIRNASSLADRDRYAATVAAYFGGSEHIDVEAASELAGASVPIIPTVPFDGDFGKHIPDFLTAANGLRRRKTDAAMTELASALLECVGLLRRQRRVFVSYRRTDSRAAALQLHDLLSSHGFDVFLDTHSIRPGDPFQEILWHRLCDSDVVVMLDTPSYFESRWTREEIGRARAKDIQVLRVIWPEHTPNKLTDLSETIYLNAADLTGADGPIVDKVADTIAMAVERLRSRSIAARFMAITGRLRADVEKVGGRIEGIGAHRAIAVRLLNDRRVWAYPVVGVPTAEMFNDIAEKAKRADQCEMPVLVYDHVGIREGWNAHLKWLDENISTVRAIKVSEAGWSLAGMEQ